MEDAAPRTAEAHATETRTEAQAPTPRAPGPPGRRPVSGEDPHTHPTAARPPRYGGMVGKARNTITERGRRTKLGELCYKSFAGDATEDKKHIDLSSEPFILVCAAGLVGSTADDVAKEVAIFRAHKAAPVVIASEGDRAFPAAMSVITVPSTDPRLAFIRATMAGPPLGHEAAPPIHAAAPPPA